MSSSNISNSGKSQLWRSLVAFCKYSLCDIYFAYIHPPWTTQIDIQCQQAYTINTYKYMINTYKYTVQYAHAISLSTYMLQNVGYFPPFQKGKPAVQLLHDTLEKGWPGNFRRASWHSRTNRASPQIWRKIFEAKFGSRHFEFGMWFLLGGELHPTPAETAISKTRIFKGCRRKTTLGKCPGFYTLLRFHLLKNEHD